MQYYLDLSQPYVKMNNLEKPVAEDSPAVGATGGMTYEGYFKMNGENKIQSDYTKMSPAPPPPDLTVGLEDERYVNHNKWQRNRDKEKSKDIELVPLTKADGEDNDIDNDDVVFRKKDNQLQAEHSPTHLHTLADVHRSEDTDSGHSSTTYAPGTSPDIGADGYLVPKTDEDGTQTFGEKPDTKIDTAPTTDSTSDSNFDRESGYNSSNHAPPTYSACLQDSDVQNLV